MSIGFWDKLTHVLKPLSGVTNLFNRTKAGLVPQAPSGNGTTKYLREDGEWIDLKSSLLDLCYPVGSFYISTKNVSPATFLGGTWASRSGYMLRGATSSVTFNSNNKDGGADSVTVTSVASHNHTQNSHNHTQNVHSHTLNYHDHFVNSGGMSGNNPHKHSVRTEYGAQGAASFPPNGTYTQLAGDSAGTKQWYNTMISNTDIAHTHQISGESSIGTSGVTPTNNSTTATNQATGGNYSVTTLPNYKNVYMWERTA